MITLAIALAAATPLPPSDKAAIMIEMDRRLFDAESARFVWPPLADPDFYCGFVNAKNRLGAYTGYQQFSARLDRLPGRTVANLVTVPANPNECARLGYDPAP